MRSRISSKGQITIPKKVLESLGLESGDLVSFELAKEDAVIVRRLDPEDAAFQGMISENLGEWGSDADDEAFRDL